MNIKPPIIIKTGAIAEFGISDITGIKKIDIKNKNPVNIEVNPVLPPAAIPALPSTVETEGLVPHIPQIIVVKATALRALCLLLGCFNIPSICTWSKPMFSNTRTKVSEKVAIQNEIEAIPLKLADKKTCLYSLKLGNDNWKLDKLTIPNNIDITVPDKIPIKNEPGTFFINKTSISIIVMKNTITSLDEISPNLTSVEASPTIKPDFCNPKKVIKIPIPTVIASFNEVGIE